MLSVFKNWQICAGKCIPTNGIMVDFTTTISMLIFVIFTFLPNLVLDFILNAEVKFVSKFDSLRSSCAVGLV